MRLLPSRGSAHLAAVCCSALLMVFICREKTAEKTMTATPAHGTMHDSSRRWVQGREGHHRPQQLVRCAVCSGVCGGCVRPMRNSQLSHSISPTASMPMVAPMPRG